MINAVNTLRELVTKYSTVTLSEVMVNADGERYQFKHTVLNYKHTPLFLKKAFENAATEVTGKWYITSFGIGNDFYSFDRAIFKGSNNGKIRISELIIL